MRTVVTEETKFHFNSDLSGEVTIQNKHGEFQVSGPDLLTFAAEHVRSQRIARLERLGTSELLALTE